MAGDSGTPPASRRVVRSRRPSPVSVAESLLQTVTGLFPGTSKVAEDSLAEIEDEIDSRLRRIPTHLNAYGYDAFGFSPVAVRRALLLTPLPYPPSFPVQPHRTQRP